MKLHLGCGKRYIPDFVHIDLANYSHIDYQRDVSDLSIFDNDTIELIYASHLLEYFDREKAKEVLKEWYRVLIIGGTLRIAVPDFDKLIAVYLKHKDLALILGPLYGKWFVDNQSGFLYHKTVYNFEALKQLLQSIGFKEVHHYNWRKSIHRLHDDYSQAYVPHMDKKNGTLISLNVEALK